MGTVIALARNGLCVAKSFLPGDSALMIPRYSLDDTVLTLSNAVTNFTGAHARTCSSSGSAPEQQFSGLDAAIGMLQLLGGILYLTKAWKMFNASLRKGAAIVRWRNAVAEWRAASEEKWTLEEQLRRDDAANNRGLVTCVCLCVIGTGLVLMGMFTYKQLALHTLICCLSGMLGCLLVVIAVGMSELMMVLSACKDLQENGLTVASFPSTVELWGPLLAKGRWTVDTFKQPTDAAIKAELDKIRKVWGAARHAPQGLLDKIVGQRRRQKAFDLVLLLLNVLALLGYLTIPVTYFWPDEKAFTWYLSSYWPGHGLAAWYGNLTGDVAWTVEPALTLLSPVIMGREDEEDDDDD